MLSDICDVRLDFDVFSTYGPALTTEVNGGECTDSFQLSGVILVQWSI